MNLSQAPDNVSARRFFQAADDLCFFFVVDFESDRRKLL